MCRKARPKTEKLALGANAPQEAALVVLWDGPCPPVSDAELRLLETYCADLIAALMIEENES